LSGATKTLKLSIGRGVQSAAALTLALAGDPVRAQAVEEDLAKRFPEDTDVRPDHLALRYRRKAWWRRYGRGLQG
jgi:hypothetical protein